MSSIIVIFTSSSRSCWSFWPGRHTLPYQLVAHSSKSVRSHLHDAPTSLHCKPKKVSFVVNLKVWFCNDLFFYQMWNHHCYSSHIFAMYHPSFHVSHSSHIHHNHLHHHQTATMIIDYHDHCHHLYGPRCQKANPVFPCYHVRSFSNMSKITT